MQSRERVLTALDGGEPDRIPCALNFYQVDLDALAPPDERVWYATLVDVDFVEFPVSAEEEQLRADSQPYSPDTRLGSTAQALNYQRWQYQPHNPARSNPLALARSLDDLRAFPFPDLRAPYVVDDLTRQVEALHARGLAAGGNLPHLGGELFEAAWRIRGLENFLLDMLERPDWAHFLLERLMELARRNAETLARAGVDLLALDDDVGMPDTMMISPEMWREFFKPRLREIIRAARALRPELRVLYHSDGCIEPIVPDLMEIGVNALNPLQPESMPAGRIRQRFGPGLALWGGVGRQTTFSFASPAEIRAEVRQRIAEVGRAGLVLCPAYDIDEPDIPWANLRAFLEAVREFG